MKSIKEEKEAQLKLFKPDKIRISKSTAKQICDADSNEISKAVCRWCEWYIETLCRERSYPLQMVSDDFVPMISKMLDASDALQLLERIRCEFRRAFPKMDTKEDFQFLLDAIATDPNAKLD
jgi:hypothetical protein